MFAAGINLLGAHPWDSGVDLDQHTRGERGKGVSRRVGPLVTWPWTKVVHHLVRLRADSAGTPERAGQHDCPSGSHFGQVAHVARQPREQGWEDLYGCVQPAGIPGGIRAGPVCLVCPASALLWLLYLVGASLSVFKFHSQGFHSNPSGQPALQQLRL